MAVVTPTPLVNPTPDLLPILPNAVWGKIIDKLDLPTTVALGKTCEHAVGVIREYMSNEAIEGLAFRILRKYTSYPYDKSTPPAFFKSKKFVLLAARLNWKRYEHAPLLYLDPEVAKTAAVSSLFSTGRINEQAAQNLEHIGETSFLKSMRVISFKEPAYYSSYKVKFFLEKFSRKNSDLWENKEFVLTAARHEPEITLSFLKKKNSPFLQNKDVFIAAAAADENAKTVLKYLWETNSDLKEDKDILIAAVVGDAWRTFEHLRKIQSPLVNDMDLLHAGVGRKKRPVWNDSGVTVVATLHHLHEIDSPHKDNKELLIAEIRHDNGMEVLEHLYKIERKVDEDLLIAVAETNVYILCNYLSLIKKPEEECVTLFIKAAYQDPKKTLKCLREKEPNLVENRDILLSAARKDPHEVLSHLSKIRSNLWQDEAFMKEMKKRSPQ
jgi:hypothetical protein